MDTYRIGDTYVMNMSIEIKYPMQTKIWIVTWNHHRWEFSDENVKLSFMEYWKLKGESITMSKIVGYEVIGIIAS